jgi:uncharacterized protein (DUF1015 family)
MAKLRPFRATLYDPQRTADYAQVLSPPYDVISPALQQTLYDRDEHNFVRIDFGQTHESDSSDNNPYTRAAAALAQWHAEGVFTTLAQAGYYLHRQRFSVDGQEHQRSDLFALCQATPFEAGDVLPHEKTLDGPKADRYALMEQAQAHLSPVFSLYQDPEAQLSSLIEPMLTQPLFSFSDGEGISHELFAVDPGLNEQIGAFFADRPLYIADGHHRYETAQAFSRAHYPALEAAGYVCMYLSAVQDPGLLVLPYHRLIRSRFEWPADLHERLAAHFSVEKISPEQLEAALEPKAGEMRLAMESSEGLWILSRPAGLPAGVAEHRASSYRELDVSVLSELLLYKLAGFPSDKAKDPEYVQFSPDIAVLRETLSSAGGVAFYLNATPVSALCAIAEQGECMPPKSTYFYPKVPSGLLFTRFDSTF